MMETFRMFAQALYTGLFRASLAMLGAITLYICNT